MPITVRQDPNNPGGWIWVDAATGQPAVQPGGPDTPWVAPSDLPSTPDPAQQQQQQQAQAAQQAATESRILNSIGRNGWTVVGRTPEMKSQSVIDPRTGIATSQLQPTGNTIWAIASPNGLNDTLTVQPKTDNPNDFNVVNPPTNIPASQLNPQSSQQATVAGTVYTPDPNNPSGPWIPRTPVDAASQQQASANVAKTLTDIGYTQAQAQALATRTPAEVQQALAAAGASQAQTQKALQDLATAQAMLPGQLAQQTAQTAQTQAQTAQSQAQTGQIQSAVQIAQAKAPSDIALTQAQTAAQQASTAANLVTAQRTQQQIAQAGTPTVENIAATTPYIYQRDPNTGQLSPQMNLAFTPKTTADVATRVGQLQAAAMQQRDQLLAQQQAGAITADQAGLRFDQWWSTNVEPQKAVLDAAQRTAMLDEQQKLQEQQRANLATAQAAGTQAIQAAQAQLPYMVGPGFGQAVNQIAQAYSSGKAPGNIDLGSAITFQMPDINALAQKATDQALAHISPTAANNMNTATGPSTPNFNPQGVPQNLDVTQQLNRTTYRPSVTVAPDGTVTVNQSAGQQAPALAQPVPQASAAPTYQPFDYNAWQQRQAQSYAEQQAQAGMFSQYQLT